MADIEATTKQDPNGDVTSWKNVTENDTPISKYFIGGEYSLAVEGNFAGSLSIAIKYGTEKGLESDLTGAVSNIFTANRTAVVKIGSGYVLPVVSSGASANVKISLTKILRS